MKILLLLLMTNNGLTQGQPQLTFEELWSQVQARSHKINAEKVKNDLSESALKRSERHWFPRLMFDAQIVSSDLPSTVLFSKLNSREVIASDFNPSSLNQPNRELFTRGGVLLDWAIYEGGSKEAQKKGSRLSLESQKVVLKFQIEEEFSNLVATASRISVLKESEVYLKEIKSRTEKLLNNYQLSSESNPVGRSGFLGLKALLNKVDSLIDQNALELKSLDLEIESTTELKNVSSRLVKMDRPISFLTERLEKSDTREVGLKTKALNLTVDAQSELLKAEKARWLPQVGLFATGNITGSPNGSGTAVEMGAYLKWSLFDASHLGVLDDANLKNTLSQHHAFEAKRMSELTRQNMELAIPVLKQSLLRTEESLNLTHQQIDIASKLFRDGAINILQLLEVLSRRLDIVSALKELNYKIITSTLAQYQN